MIVSWKSANAFLTKRSMRLVFAPIDASPSITTFRDGMPSFRAAIVVRHSCCAEGGIKEERLDVCVRERERNEGEKMK